MTTDPTYTKWSTYFSRIHPPSHIPASKLEPMEMTPSEFEKCEKWKSKVMRDSPLIKFISQHLSTMGCPQLRTRCQPCDESRSGGFSPEHGVILCANRVYSKSHLQETLAHEMIHALDHCRVKLDFNNCLHHACTEIRAASLSGDCRWFNEFRRGHFNIYKQHQRCVRRRAALSLQSNPNCAKDADLAVSEVWNACFNDTWPFDEIF